MSGDRWTIIGATALLIIVFAPLLERILKELREIRDVLHRIRINDRDKDFGDF